MKVRTKYRYVSALTDIIATGKVTEPILYCEDMGIGHKPTNFNSHHDLYIKGTLYVRDLIYAVNYDKNEYLREVLNGL